VAINGAKCYFVEQNKIITEIIPYQAHGPLARKDPRSGAGLLLECQ